MSDLKRVALTGIKPSGLPHIGNYFGAIRPGLSLADEQSVESFYFIADYHAMTTVRDRAILSEQIDSVAATWLAFGLDPSKTIFYRQSDVPEVFELAWILSCYTPKSFMNKAHAYKSMSEKNSAEDVSRDSGINIGLFTYPILMAADILIADTDLVPVGKDQVQHVEIARNIASRINHSYGKGILTVPSAYVVDDINTIPGLDGRKMSKSYGNTIPCFSTAKRLRKSIMRIKTNSLQPNEPKDPDTSLVFQIHSSFLSKGDEKMLAEEYRNGISWGNAKSLLYEEIERHVSEPREQYNELMSDRIRLNELLSAGAARARERSMSVLNRVKEAVGIVK